MANANATQKRWEAHSKCYGDTATTLIQPAQRTMCQERSTSITTAHQWLLYYKSASYLDIYLFTTVGLQKDRLWLFMTEICLIRECVRVVARNSCMHIGVIHHVIMESARPYDFKPSFTRLSIDSSQVTLQIHRQSGHQTRCMNCQACSQIRLFCWWKSTVVGLSL